MTNHLALIIKPFCVLHDDVGVGVKETVLQGRSDAKSLVKKCQNTWQATVSGPPADHKRKKGPGRMA